MGNRAGSQELIQLGERIRQKRKDSHLTQETFAEKAGISVNTVSRIEGGQAAMSIEIFAKLVEILDADANELLGRNPEEMGNPAHRMFSRVKNLRPKEQKIVIQTMSALMDGIEGIYDKIHRYGRESCMFPHICKGKITGRMIHWICKAQKLERREKG